MDDAQVQAMVHQWREQQKKQLDELKVRQWCVERAIECAKAGGPFNPNGIFQFVTAPFAELFTEAKSEPTRDSSVDFSDERPF